jgi:hypothetical protein
MGVDKGLYILVSFLSRLFTTAGVIPFKKCPFGAWCVTGQPTQEA